MGIQFDLELSMRERRESFHDKFGSIFFSRCCLLLLPGVPAGLLLLLLLEKALISEGLMAEAALEGGELGGGL